ncbi:MAG: hypothetical protein CME65_03180 [Halobacteriovoraceae bacterium]|nr:hypothetical protein [Halobacteriovoraceae bacterium]|tara:strand:+ start:3673 stop:4635 length:963 start_codon:yes stop_codon:yes gene_type:complete
MERKHNFNWNHLFYFYQVAELGSLKKGASLLGLAPSTVSEQLKKLESKLGSKLIQKSGSGIKLTSEGQKLLSRCRSIFEEGNKLLEEISEDVIGGYPVKIGIDETISYDVSNEFASQYWDYYTTFGSVYTYRQQNHETLIQSLNQGLIDWGISIQKPIKKSLEYAEIGSFEVVFCCSEELFNRFIDPIDLLNNIPFGESNWDKVLNKSVYKYLKQHGVIPQERILSDHSGFLQKLCRRGRCVTYMAKNPMQKYPGLRTFSLDNPLRVTLYAIWKKSDSGLVAITRLKDLINSTFSTLPHRYKDVDLQIEVSEVSEDLLKK